VKVALVQCPVWGTREPPLGLVQLSGCLKAAGFETKSFDLNNYLYRHRSKSFENLWAWEQSQFWYNSDSVAAFFASIADTIDTFAGGVLDFSPRLIGFTVTASTFASTVLMAGLLKKKDPACVIVFGGQSFFMDPRAVDRAFSESSIDYIVPRDGDTVLPELAGIIEHNGDIRSCRGLYFREGRKVEYTGEPVLLSSLDSLAYMDYTDLRLEDYDDNRHFLIMASRGCVWNCAFCSSRSFWDKYRYMSGERLHQEIVYHKTMVSTDVRHIDFADLAFNGNMERVRTFCDLMVRYPPMPNERIHWLANAIIHPELTPETLSLMASAGCDRLIFGIESGSPSLLKRIHKNYDPAVAVRVIRDARAAGIRVTCNFMFGFPGETESDFEQTLDFLRAIAASVDCVYPSRTYCAMEEFSYFFSHPDEFGVKTPITHHLYWESVDGTNTYPVRLKRCQRFELLCRELGVRVDNGVQTAVDMDEWFNLGHYYEYRGEYGRALEYFKKYAAEDPDNEVISRKIREISAGRGAGM
jgi:anaerobic magnesium-protoporphyrin IX monomethyl ester cyclase